MKKLILSSWIIFLGASWNGWSDQIQLDIKGEAGILLNIENGAILFEKEAHQVRYPASTTKIGTALYALQMGQNLDTLITADQEALATIKPENKRKSNYSLPAYWNETDGTHIGIKKGEEMSFLSLLEGMLISSGNDAANVIAQSLGKGSIPQFMEQLNQFLKEIGCRHTHFCNPHGLHHPNHQTTAYDLAIMTREALKNPTFCQIVKQTRFFRPKTNKQKPATLIQTNLLLRSGKFHYSKAIGVKTGYHSKAKHNFVAAAQMGDRTLVAVLMGYQYRIQIFEDAIKLFDAAFNQPKVQRVFLQAGPQKIVKQLPSTEKLLETYLPEAITLDYYPAEEPQVKCLLQWNHLELPIQKDQIVGEVQLVTTTNQILKTTPLLALNPVEIKKTWWHETVSVHLILPILLGIFFVGGITWLYFTLSRAKD